VRRWLQSGGDVGEICRKLGVTRTTFYRWKSKYGGLGLSETKHLKQLEDENRRLKKIVADQTLDMQILKEVLAKQW
jgi:putative transposase